MDAKGIDPRDISWEVAYPTYRVYFWRLRDSRSDEWHLTDAVNVHDVLAWAEARVQPGWIYQVFVESTSEQGRLGTIRLLGSDPSDPDSPPR